jgi:hypothetical protein
MHRQRKRTVTENAETLQYEKRTLFHIPREFDCSNSHLFSLSAASLRLRSFSCRRDSLYTRNFDRMSTFAAHPREARLSDAARLTDRGNEAKFLVKKDDAVLTLDDGNAWLEKEEGYGPEEEVGLRHDQWERILYRACRPKDEDFLDTDLIANELSLKKMSLIWDRLVTDGLEMKSYESEGALKAAIDVLVNSLDIASLHDDYLVGDEDMELLQATPDDVEDAWWNQCPLRAFASHESGWLVPASEFLYFARARHLADDRVDEEGSFRDGIVALWCEAETTLSAAQKRAGVTGPRRMHAIIEWLDVSRPHPHLTEGWSLRRSGSLERVLEVERQIRSAQLSGDRIQVKLALQKSLAVVLRKCDNIKFVIEPAASTKETFDNLQVLARVLLSDSDGAPDYASVLRLESVLQPSDVGAGVDWVGWVTSFCPADCAGKDKVARVLGEVARGAQVASAAPKASPRSLGSDTEVGVLDQEQTRLVTAAFREPRFKAWLVGFEALLAPPAVGAVGGGEGAAAVAFQPDPFALLAKMFLCPIKAVRRFAAGNLPALPHASFEHEAVTSSRGHVAAYLAHAVMTKADGTPEVQKGKRLELPKSMVAAVLKQAWDEVRRCPDRSPAW